ncbi:MAG: hypothetical protein IT566_10925 [Rhodospirillaceae bacterium]|nr:hypothetical protein [Rhodospirillaceae bacterium]
MTDTTAHVTVTVEILTVPTIVYVLYGLGFFFAPLALVGVIMAHTGMANAGPIALSHFSYQARTFWFGLVTLIVAGMIGVSYLVVNFAAMMAETPAGDEFLMPEGAPPVLIVSGALFLWWIVWTLVRCIKGLVTVLARKAMPKPTTLLW